MLSVSINQKEAKHISTHHTESHCNSIHSKQMRDKDIAMYVVKQREKSSQKKGSAVLILSSAAFCAHLSCPCECGLA